MGNQVLKSFRDKTNKEKRYKERDVYESEDAKRVEFLIENGFLASAEQEREENLSQLNHVGGGYYELPDGEKVKGKTEALAALKELEVRGE